MTGLGYIGKTQKYCLFWFWVLFLKINYPAKIDASTIFPPGENMNDNLWGSCVFIPFRSQTSSVFDSAPEKKNIFSRPCYWRDPNI